MCTPLNNIANIFSCLGGNFAWLMVWGNVCTPFNNIANVFSCLGADLHTNKSHFLPFATIKFYSFFNLIQFLSNMFFVSTSHKSYTTMQGLFSRTRKSEFPSST